MKHMMMTTFVVLAALALFAGVQAQAATQCQGNPMAKTWNEFLKPYWDNGTNATRPWGVSTGASYSFAAAQQFCKKTADGNGNASSCCNLNATQYMGQKFANKTAWLLKERDYRLKNFTGKVDWARNNTGKIVDMLADLGATIDSTLRLATKFMKKARATWKQDFSGFPTDLDLSLAIGIYTELYDKVEKNADLMNMLPPELKEKLSALPDLRAMKIPGMPKRNRLLQDLPGMSGDFNIDDLIKNMTNGDGGLVLPGGMGGLLGDKFAWPDSLQIDNGGAIDQKMGGVLNGTGPTDEVDFKQMRLKWKAAIAPMLKPKFKILQDSKKYAFGVQQGCLNLLLQMTASQACLACDVDWKTKLKSYTDGTTAGGAAMTKYKLKYSWRVGEKLQSECFPMISGLSKLGKDYLELVKMKVAWSKYRDAKELYRKVRKVLEKFVNSDLKKGGIEGLLRDIKSQAPEWLVRAVKLWKDATQMLRAEKLENMVFPMPKNCSAKKNDGSGGCLDWIKPWLGASGPQLDMVAQLKGFRPGYDRAAKTWKSNYTFDDFYGEDEQGSELFGDLDALAAKIGTQVDCDVEKLIMGDKNATQYCKDWWASIKNATKPDNWTNQTNGTMGGNGTQPNRTTPGRFRRRMLQGGSTDSPAEPEWAASSTEPSAGSFDAQVDDPVGDVIGPSFATGSSDLVPGLPASETDDAAQARADAAAISQVSTTEDSGAVGGTVFSDCDSQADCDASEEGGFGAGGDSGTSGWVWVGIAILVILLVGGIGYLYMQKRKDDEMTDFGQESGHHVTNTSSHQNVEMH